MLLESNIFTVLCGIVAVYFSVRLYHIVRARSVLMLVIALSYLTVLRATVTYDQHVHVEGWFALHTSYLLIPSWPLLALGMYLLYRALQGPLNGNHPPDG
jgi:hypothetical protein